MGAVETAILSAVTLKKLHQLFAVLWKVEGGNVGPFGGDPLPRFTGVAVYDFPICTGASAGFRFGYKNEIMGS